MKPTCSYDLCPSLSKVRGYCNAHYKKLRATGELPLAKVTRKSSDDFATYFWNQTKPDPDSDCILWTRGTNRNGYGRVDFEGRKPGAHTVAYYLTHGHWPKPMCLHSCDNRPCVNPDHLRQGTGVENNRDMVERGRNPFNQLSESDTSAIRNRYAMGDTTYRALGEEFGVSRQTISNAINGRKTRD